MAYIGWAANVNKIILDSTAITVGEGATVTDSLETGGQKKSRLVCANPPDKYSVTMNFSFAEESKDENGLTECDRFWAWYKWAHCYGTNPFQFPAILLNSNRQKGFSVEETEYGNLPDMEYYVITSAVNGAKSGTDQQITMEWSTYATGVITIPTEIATVDHIKAQNGYVDIILTDSLSVEPSTATYTIKINGTKEPILYSVYDGDRNVRYFFEKRTQGGSYTVTLGSEESTFIVLED